MIIQEIRILFHNVYKETLLIFRSKKLNIGKVFLYSSVSASKEGVVHNRSFFVILTTDSFEALFISYFKPAGIW